MGKDAAERMATRGRLRLPLMLAALASLVAGCQPFVSPLEQLRAPAACPWEMDPSRCVRLEWPGYAGALGVSDPLPSERAADAQAIEDAVGKLLAQLLGVEVASELHVERVEQLSEHTPERSRSEVQVFVRRQFRLGGNLPEFEVLRRSVERRPGSYVVRVLVGVKDPERVRRAFEASVVAGLSSSRSKLDAELAAHRRGEDGALEPLAAAVAGLEAYLNVAERLHARSPLASIDLGAHRDAVAKARELLLARYHQRLERLKAQDAHPIAIELTVRLARATNDPVWDARLVAAVAAAQDRARALARQGYYEQALAMLTVTRETLEYLKSARPELALQLANLRGELERSRAASVPRHLRALRILVVVPEQVLSAWVPDPAVETELVRRLSEAGFRVVDPLGAADRQALSARLAAQGTAATGGGPGRFRDALRDLRAALGVDVLVTGEAFAQPAARLGGMMSARARVELRAIRTDTGEVLGSYATHASGVDLTDQTAAKKALQEAGTRAGGWLVELLSDPTPALPQRIELVIAGVGFDHVQALVKRIGVVDGVRSVTLRDFANGTLWLDVEGALAPLELATHLADTLEVLRVSASRIEAVVTPLT